MNRLLEVSSQAWLPLLEGAFFYTISLSLITFSIGLILGLFCALGRLSSRKLLRALSRIYISTFRGTPLLVQLFIIFYGLPNIGIILQPYFAAIIGLSLNVGAYSSEIIRAAILSIPRGQWDAAHSIGMNYAQAMRRIVLPQAQRVAIPPLSNSFLSLIKDSSLTALILVSELFRRAQEIAAVTYEILLLYSQVALIYWVICFLLSLLQNQMEKRLERHVSTIP